MKEATEEIEVIEAIEVIEETETIEGTETIEMEDSLEEAVLKLLIFATIAGKLAIGKKIFISYFFINF